MTEDFGGEKKTDYYGRPAPKDAHGSENIGQFTSSTKLILDVVGRLYDRIVNPAYTVRRIYVVANHVIPEKDVSARTRCEQLSLFTDYDAEERRRREAAVARAKEKRMQETVLEIKRRYGKNAILKGMNLEEGATQRARNGMIGGHKE